QGFATAADPAGYQRSDDSGPALAESDNDAGPSPQKRKTFFRSGDDASGADYRLRDSLDSGGGSAAGRAPPGPAEQRSRVAAGAARDARCDRPLQGFGGP